MPDMEVSPEERDRLVELKFSDILGRDGVKSIVVGWINEVFDERASQSGGKQRPQPVINRESQQESGGEQQGGRRSLLEVALGMR